MTQATARPSARALAVHPAGSNGEFDFPAERVVVLARGTGSRVWDATGRELLDFSMGWGSVLPGHAHPAVVRAVAEQLPSGTNFACVSERSLALAETLQRLLPWCERLRFCASGSEATMYCVRLARAHTGRPVVVKFEGAYHGSSDVGVTSLFPDGSVDLPRPVATSAGVQEAVEGTVLVAPFNDLVATSRIVERDAARIAAVLVEPLQRCIPPVPGFLEGLRALTRRVGALLVFDEVVTGFRLALGGAAERYGVAPDLVAYGKALGGGLPIGAFGGSGEVMDHLREDRLGRPDYVWSASTLGGNPVSAAAALAALDLYQDPATYAHLDHLGVVLRAQLRSVLHSRRVDAQVIGDGPLAQVVFTKEPVVGYRSMLHADRARSRRTMLGLLDRGVFVNPMGTKLYLSLAHDDASCVALAERFDAALFDA